MQEVAVSVIIPVYNSERYLKECLDSVFNQSFEHPYEVIASVNGSTDNSINILKEYSKSHPNLVIINDPINKGAAKARIDGINKARGKYVAFIDSDDLYHKDFLKVMYETIEVGYDIVGCNFYYLYDTKARKSILKANYELNSIKATRALLRDYTMRGYMWNKMYRKDLFTEQKVYYPKDPKTLFEDIVTLYNILANIHSFKAIKTSLYYYRKSQASVTSTVNIERFNHHLYAFCFIRYLCDQNENKAYLKSFRRTFWRTRLSLFFDAYLLRKQFHHGPFKHLRIYKKEIRALKDIKKPLPIEGEVYEQYIKDCLD
ncbi:MAG: glycosyltransferase family 2 protein [Erysipelotrichaceae bacterium]|nr:glycosyltransferase family 2 protein [Erysipelotrichaceae bacterium]